MYRWDEDMIAGLNIADAGLLSWEFNIRSHS